MTSFRGSVRGRRRWKRDAQCGGHKIWSSHGRYSTLRIPFALTSTLSITTRRKQGSATTLRRSLRRAYNSSLCDTAS